MELHCENIKKADSYKKNFDLFITYFDLNSM
jgi:hypothetical protein